MTLPPEKPGAYHLIKNGVIIYVGSAKNLLQRFMDWKERPEENPCIKRNGWERFNFQETSTHREALALELEWYQKYRPICNLITPPGK